MSAPISLRSRIRGSFLGMAVCDALGGPVEFKPRDTFSKVTSMLPNANFGIPAGCFTDDTSMALCLARSLLDRSGRHDTADQVKKYIAWWRKGYMSSTGECFDIGNLTRDALSVWSEYLAKQGQRRNPDDNAQQAAAREAQADVVARYSGERFCGNGSLMRVLPVALVSEDHDMAIELARQSSLPTHPHTRCQHACMIYVSVVVQALQGCSKSTMASTLGCSISSTRSPHHRGRVAGEYVEAVLKQRLGRYQTVEDWRSTPPDSIRSTGYVVDSLEAALWAFFSTDSFEQGATRAVNLGDDADTIGAIYGGLAGAFYSVDGVPERWIADMKNIDLMEDVVEDIIEYRCAVKG
ncbi:hypothetical protein PV08_00459 [Exophiala spinifera]|uniref:ADP-ribosylhydrolase ARH3 n=1 Tax=Exophiala spinifera TaxID=91928 RepID=A0A0D2C8L2_9EURO|nr:uncharacterized protein PV08_00459 [Exophiala spinifera]KIW19884.1 hypothetical protein PV08_00459 [Exophiala spinifera]